MMHSAFWHHRSTSCHQCLRDSSNRELGSPFLLRLSFLAFNKWSQFPKIELLQFSILYFNKPWKFIYYVACQKVGILIDRSIPEECIYHYFQHSYCCKVIQSKKEIPLSTVVSNDSASCGPSARVLLSL